MKRTLLLLAFALGVASLPSSRWEAQAQDAAPHSAALTLSGQVTLDDGRPAVGYVVVVSSTDYVSPSPAGTALTDAAGRYTVTVVSSLAAGLFVDGQAPPDTHFCVTVRIGDGLYLRPSAQPVVLAPGRPDQGVDFRVTSGPQITVRVHDALTGLPVPGMVVKDNQFGGGNGPTLGVTDARGIAVFRLKSLNANLDLEPPGGASATVQAAPGYPFYDQIWQTQVQDVTWDVRTYPISLPPTSLWHGVILEPNGRPAGGATVHILRSNGEVVLGTDGTGHFSALLPPLGTGEYQEYGGDKLFAVLAERGAQSILITPKPDATWDGLALRSATSRWPPTRAWWWTPRAALRREFR